MSAHKRRISAIRALVAGCPAIVNDPTYRDIDNEINETYRVRKVRVNHRRWLLQILHSTRALDSSLKVFTNFHNIPSRSSLGGYLTSLVGHNSLTIQNHLNQADKDQFQRDIVDKRNKYMHEAGAFPLNDMEVGTLLSNMQVCMSIVISL